VPDNLTDFLSVAYSEAGLPEAQREHLRKHVEPHLRYVVGGGGVNPREIKRYINAYTLQRSVGEALDPDVVLTLQTIAFRPEWRRVHAGILAYGPLFIETLGRALAGFGQPSIVQESDPELTLPDSFLAYVAPDRPGNVILERKDERFVHADDIDRYVYRGEAVRTAQDPALLSAIRGSCEARRLLTEAKAHVEDRARLIDQARRAMGKSRLGTYMEFGLGSIVVRELLLRDWNAYYKAEARLRDPEREPDLQEQDLEEAGRFAGSISERLLGIYRTGEARHEV
jgi:hypothetical protein